MPRPPLDRPSDLRRQIARSRSLTLRDRVSRLHAIVAAAEERAAQRQHQVQALCASADLLCERSIRGVRTALLIREMEAAARPRDPAPHRPPGA